MPITPFLRNHVFDPETLEAMSVAFVEACSTLGLTDRADQITELVAERIIDLASQGIHTKTALYISTIRQFKSNPQ